MKILEALESWLADGFHRMGEVLICGFELRHHADDGRGDLETLRKPEDAREIAKYDDAGNYRPLKSAPNLRHGWSLSLKDLSEVREALDFLYPAMLGIWLAQMERRLTPVDFRETANRQSGMYAAVKTIADDEADGLIGNFCASDGKCLKTILWRIDSARPITSLPATKFDAAIDQLGLGEKALPLPCAEACNLLVAAARNLVKKTARTA